MPIQTGPVSPPTIPLSSSLHPSAAPAYSASSMGHPDRPSPAASHPSSLGRAAPAVLAATAVDSGPFFALDRRICSCTQGQPEAQNPDSNSPQVPVTGQRKSRRTDGRGSQRWEVSFQVWCSNFVTVSAFFPYSSSSSHEYSKGIFTCMPSKRESRRGKMSRSWGY